MIYQSTRNDQLCASAAEAILQGIAPDGGLYVPQGGKLPQLPLHETLSLTADELPAHVMGALLPDFADLPQLAEQAYSGRFTAPGLTPLQAVGNAYVLELFHGPTSAFKDVALCMLPQLITAARKKLGVEDEIVILTATSGDTGKAALEGFCDVEGTRIIVFYPESGVSCVQKAQMVTQKGKNVRVCGVRGNFDDAQSAVKSIFAACDEKVLGEKKIRLSSANSINIGRLVPQTVYYFKAYADLVRSGAICEGDLVDFVVPTGNFGNILAGYLAKKMGLPVGHLVCASNQNDVLTDFLKTGRYDRNRPFHKTISPSMDILISSNLERLLYLESGDAALVASLMKQLAEKGYYEVPADLLAKIQETFVADCCGEADTKKTICEVWDKYGYLMDPHTAVAWYASEQRGNNANTTVVLSTASAYKFPAAVMDALGLRTSKNEFADMGRLHEFTGAAIPKNLCGLESRAVLHSDVKNREELLSYVLEQVGV